MVSRFSRRQVARRGAGMTSARPSILGPTLEGFSSRGFNDDGSEGLKQNEQTRFGVRSFTGRNYASILGRPVCIPAMSRPRLPLEALPVWTSFNNGILSNVGVESVPHKGSGLIAKKDSADIGDSPLISIPHSLVLNMEAVEEYAKEDRSFRQLLDVCGHKVSSTALTTSLPC